MAFENRPKDFFAKQIRSSHLIASGGIIDPESSDWDEQLPHLRLMIYPRDTLEVDTSTGATEYIDGAFEGIIPSTLLNDVKYNDDGQVVGGSGLKVGQDVWLFISGAQGTTHMDHDGDGELELSEMERRSDHGVVLFGGDVVVSGTLFAERQVIEVDLSHEGQLFVSGNLRAQDYNRDINFVQFRSPGYREDVQYPDLWLSGEEAMLTHLGSHANPKMWTTNTGIMTAKEAGHTGFFEAPAYVDHVIGASTLRFTAGTDHVGVAGNSLSVVFATGGTGTTESFNAGTGILTITVEVTATTIADIVAVGPGADEVIISLLVDGDDTGDASVVTVALNGITAALTNGNQFGTATAGRANGSPAVADPDGDGTPVSGYITCTEAQWAEYARGGPYVNKVLRTFKSTAATLVINGPGFGHGDKIFIEFGSTSEQLICNASDDLGPEGELIAPHTVEFYRPGGSAWPASPTASDLENQAAYIVEAITEFGSDATAFNITRDGATITFTFTTTQDIANADLPEAMTLRMDPLSLEDIHTVTDGVIGQADADGTVLNLTTINPAFDTTTGIALNDLRDDDGVLVDPIAYYTITQLNAAIAQAAGAIFANRNDAIEAGSGFLAFNPGDTLANSSVIFNVDSVHEQVGINTAIPSASLDVRRRQVRNDNSRSIINSAGTWTNEGNEQVTFLLHEDDAIGHLGTSNPLSDGASQHDDVSFYVWGRPDAKAEFGDGDTHIAGGPYLEGQRKSVAGFGGDVVISGTLYTENGILVLSSFHDTIDGTTLVDNSTNTPLGTIQFEATETGSDFATGVAARIEVEAAGAWVGSGGATPARLNFYTDDDTDPAFTIANDGDIGIGTEDPDAQLEIIQASDTGIGLKLSYTKSDGTPAGVYTDFKVTTGGHLDITPTGDTARVTSDGDTVLQVQSDAVDGNVSINFDVTGDNIPNWSIGVDDGDSDKLKIDVDGTVGANTAVTILQTNKNVGIGTDDPRSKLDVEGNLTVGSSYSGTSAGPAEGVIIEGSVGVGTDSPDVKLEIVDTGEQLRLTHTDSAKYTKFHVDGDFTIENIFGDIILDPSTGITQAIGSDGTGGTVRQDQAQAFNSDGLHLTDQNNSGIKIYEGGNLDAAPSAVLADAVPGSILPISGSAFMNGTAPLHIAQVNIIGRSTNYTKFWGLNTAPNADSAEDGEWGTDGNAAHHPLRLHGLKEDNTNYHPSGPGDDCIQPKVLVAGADGHVMYTESVLGRLGQDRDSRYYDQDAAGASTWPNSNPMGDDAAGVVGVPYDNGYIIPEYDGAYSSPVHGWDGDTPVGLAIDDLNHGLREVDENNPWNWDDIDSVVGGDVVVLKDSTNRVGLGTTLPDSKVHMAVLGGDDIDIKIEASQFDSQDPTLGTDVNDVPISRLDFSFDSKYWTTQNQADDVTAVTTIPAENAAPSTQHITDLLAARASAAAATPALSIAALTRLGHTADGVVDIIMQGGRSGGDVNIATQHYGNMIAADGTERGENLPILDVAGNDTGVDLPGTADLGSLSPFKIRGDTHRERLQVLILSGTTTLTDPAALDPKYFADVNFFVSGSTGSAATAAAPMGSGIRGAACFGGDVVVSGTLYANVVPMSAPNSPHVVYFEQQARTIVYNAPGSVAPMNSITLGVNIHPLALGLGDDPERSDDAVAWDAHSTIANWTGTALSLGATAYKNRLSVFINGQRIEPNEYILDGSDGQAIKLTTGLSTGDKIVIDRGGDPNDWGAAPGHHARDLLDVRADTPASFNWQVLPSGESIQLLYIAAIGTNGNGLPVEIIEAADNTVLDAVWDDNPASVTYGLTINLTYDTVNSTTVPTYDEIVAEINNKAPGNILASHNTTGGNHIDIYSPAGVLAPGSYSFANGSNTPLGNSILKWDTAAASWRADTIGSTTPAQPVVVYNSAGSIIEGNAQYLKFEGDVTIAAGGSVGGLQGAVVTVNPLALNDLTNVVVPAPNDGDILKFDLAAGDWAAAADETGTDTTVTIQEEGTNVVTAMEILNFEGSAVTVTDVGGVATVTVDASSTLSALDDVNLATAPGNGNMLKYDELSGDWLPAREIYALDTMTSINADYATPTPGTSGGDVAAIAGTISMITGGPEQPAAMALEITKKYTSAGSASFSYGMSASSYITPALTASGENLTLFYIGGGINGTDGDGTTVILNGINNSSGTQIAPTVVWDPGTSTLTVNYVYSGNPTTTNIMQMALAFNVPALAGQWTAIVTGGSNYFALVNIDTSGTYTTSGGVDAELMTISTNSNVIDSNGVRIEFMAAPAAATYASYQRAERTVGLVSKMLDIYTIHMDAGVAMVTAADIETAINNLQATGDVNMLTVSSPSVPTGAIVHEVLPNYDPSLHTPPDPGGHLTGEIFAYIMFDGTSLADTGFSTTMGSWSGLTVGEGYTPIADTDLATKEYINGVVNTVGEEMGIMMEFLHSPVRATPVTGPVDPADPGVAVEVVDFYDTPMKWWPQIIPIRSDNSGPITIMLPAPNDSRLYGAQQFIFKDELGNASTVHGAGNTISIMPNMFGTIDNYTTASPVQLTGDYDSITVYTDGTSWHLI